LIEPEPLFSLCLDASFMRRRIVHMVEKKELNRRQKSEFSASIVSFSASRLVCPAIMLMRSQRHRLLAVSDNY
jgi:CRISPR/Cas system-associated endoribonuclease Cas2